MLPMPFLFVSEGQFPGRQLFLSPRAVPPSFACHRFWWEVSSQTYCYVFEGDGVFLSFSCFYNFALFLWFLAVLLWITEGYFAFYWPSVGFSELLESLDWCFLLLLENSWPLSILTSFHVSLGCMCVRSLCPAYLGDSSCVFHLRVCWFSCGLPST